MHPTTPRRGKRLDTLGPGYITGASDDDPSGILTYIQAGVVMGLQALWVVVLMFPLMYGIQEICGRIGYVTGKGLIKSLREHIPRSLLYILVCIAAGVIIVNIGADMLAIGSVLEHLTGIGRVLWIVLCGSLLMAGIILFSYQRIARVLKWFAFSLVFYIICAFFIDISWKEAILQAFTPSFLFAKESVFLIAAMIGATISPYLFFWQVSEEAEEHDLHMEQNHLKRFVVTKRMRRVIKRDTFFGMLFSVFVMWCIVMTGAYLSRHTGMGALESFDAAARALEPLLGNLAYFIFSLGVIGTGLLAIPVLAGSAGYMIAETYNWQEGFNKKFKQAQGFYGAILLAMSLGVILALLRFNPISLLIGAAVLYALLTPFFILILMRIANSKKIMGKHKNGLAANILGWLAFGVSTATIIAYISLVV